MTQTKTVPLTKAYGPLGSLPLMDKGKPIQSFMKLAEEHGPIFQFQFPKHKATFVSGHELVKELCDESRFDKYVHPSLQRIRAFTGDGLFTGETQELNWKKAHNILLPSFSQKAMKGYHEKMVDIAVQLVQKWSRLNQKEEVHVSDDMTRLTLDTIGLCGFHYRFNSFYREEAHPFIQSMVRALDEAMNQSQRLGIQNKLSVKAKRQFQQDAEDMFKLVDELIKERKTRGNQGEDDLLSHMLEGLDPQTGEQLSDENIRFQIITFLIAGHETTSGLLSFAIYYLLKHSDIREKAYQEVDEVLGEGAPTYKQVKQLKYIRHILNETLRLWPTAPVFALYAKEDTTIGSGIRFQKGEAASVLLPQLHRDKEAWGDDAHEFRPERFEDEKSIPHHAFKPFGNGQRACIGQQFAMHEATLVLAMLLQHFEFKDHRDYQLDVKETLTLKPEGLTMQVRNRHQHMGFAISSSSSPQRETENDQASATAPKHGTPLLVLYGSNLGTAKGVAEDLAHTGDAKGFTTAIGTLDEYAGLLPKEGAVLVVSASYNGYPPDNAADFMEWLDHIPDGELAGVHYSVFGCGDRNWAATYQRIPQLIDEKMSAKGAAPMFNRGEGDASDDFEGQYEYWEQSLWSEMENLFDIHLEEGESEHSLTVDFVSGVTETTLAKNHHAFTAAIRENRELQSTYSPRSTRHLELELPYGVSYQEGDHIGIIPKNNEALVSRVLYQFQIPMDQHIVITANAGKNAHLPLNQTIQIADILKDYVELQEPVSRAQLRELASFTTCPPHKVELEQLLEEESYKEEVLKKRITMLELLEQYPACELPFERFMTLLPPLKARYYSISSSPSVQANRASITVSVVEDTAWSGKGEYRGVASTYLKDLKEGDQVACFIHPQQASFRLPDDPTRPIVLIGPGTGVAPLRGFLQARKTMQQNGIEIGEAYLYFGCRHPEEDYLYKEELASFEKKGIVTLRTAFSRIQDKKKYVQHVMEEDGKHLIELLEKGAYLYVCGDGSAMAPAVESTLKELYAGHYQASLDEADRWLLGLQKKGYYAKDVWAG
ncbi:bifunctional cytochrome P450/NADPH--P450 reductase [Pontibacillus salicampi]|uniref:Bifunctional cytochrome P450/NADPH--P450 reductase n=1 Tax=Pontibacillus salicampi TaxID=1449801 RepID=A0ABV6LQK9_9BACI